MPGGTRGLSGGPPRRRGQHPGIGGGSGARCGGGPGRGHDPLTGFGRRLRGVSPPGDQTPPPGNSRRDRGGSAGPLPSPAASRRTRRFFPPFRRAPGEGGFFPPPHGRLGGGGGAYPGGHEAGSPLRPLHPAADPGAGAPAGAFLPSCRGITVHHQRPLPLRSTGAVAVYGQQRGFLDADGRVGRRAEGFLEVHPGGAGKTGAEPSGHR
ncbi:MAG: hypothetical protein BWY88_01226 [Synergistetes bacterium ADurb.Bin520]|nr:MAG: hypothetical protein BWY88_01226 [Synergistetes bacterium ADurb.Bin520]